MVDETTIRTDPSARARRTGAAAGTGGRLVGPDRKALVDGGMSRRQAAKVLGVSHAAINKDVGNKVSKNGNKVSTRERLSNER
jgi:hypothetical protein